MAGGVIFERLVALGEQGLEGDDLAVAENDEGLDIADVDSAVREGLGGEGGIRGGGGPRVFLPPPISWSAMAMRLGRTAIW